MMRDKTEPLLPACAADQHRSDHHDAQQYWRHALAAFAFVSALLLVVGVPRSHAESGNGQLVDGRALMAWTLLDPDPSALLWKLRQTRRQLLSPKALSKAPIADQEVLMGYLTVPLDYDEASPANKITLKLRVTAVLACGRSEAPEARTAAPFSRTATTAPTTPSASSNVACSMMAGCMRAASRASACPLTQMDSPFSTIARRASIRRRNLRPARGTRWGT